MSPLRNRLTILKVSTVLALAALCFNPRTFSPTRASQSPILSIVFTGTDSGGTVSLTAAQLSDYSLDRRQFCFAVANLSNGTILGIRSNLVTLDVVPIGPFGSAAICGRLSSGNVTSPVGLTAQDIAMSLVVIYDLGQIELCHLPGHLTCDFDTGHRLGVTYLIDPLIPNQACFTICNNPEDPITGLGFDLPESRGPFALVSVEPSCQNLNGGNKSLTFLTGIEGIHGFSNATLDFAMTTGNTFAGGGNPLQSSKFCVSGNFEGLTPAGLASSVYVNFRGDGNIMHVICTADCPCCSGALTGILSGSPR
jgi:hypothetical protein